MRKEKPIHRWQEALSSKACLLANSLRGSIVGLANALTSVNPSRACAICQRPGRREAVDDGVPFPTPRMSDPEFHHGFAGDEDRHHRPRSAPLSKLVANASRTASKPGLTGSANRRGALASPEIPSRRLRVHHCLRVFLDVGLRADADLSAEGYAFCRVRCGWRNEDTRFRSAISQPAPTEIHGAIGEINGGRIAAGKEASGLTAKSC